ncbi:hypothetical protein OSTOST_05871, partial [Ostertagia ostertagi]
MEPIPRTIRSEGSIPAESLRTAYAKGVMTIVYIAVFLIGTPGNLWIIFKLIQARLLSTATIGLSISQRSRIYIFALACSDLVLLLTLPLTASYNYKGNLDLWRIYVLRSFDDRNCCQTLLNRSAYGDEPRAIFYSMHKAENSMRFVDDQCPVGGRHVVLCGSAVYFPLFSHHPPSIHHSRDGTHNCLYTKYGRSCVQYVRPIHICRRICGTILSDDCLLHTACSPCESEIQKQKRCGEVQRKPLREPRYMLEMRKSIWRIAVFHFVCWAPFWAFAIVPHYIAQLWGHAFLERFTRL